MKGLNRQGAKIAKEKLEQEIFLAFAFSWRPWRLGGCLKS